VDEPAAKVSEVFASVQGEGVHAGRMHLFVRFVGCNLNCAYCDTSRRATRRAAVEFPPGSSVREYLDSPVSVSALLAQLERFTTGAYRYHALALTGGEPLLQPLGCLRALSAWARAHQMKTLLETNGTLHRRMQSLAPDIDIVAMDIKLPSATGEAARWEDNRAFLKAAGRAAETFVKVIVAPETQRSEMERAAEIVAEADATIPLVIQPVTPRRGGRFPDAALLFALYRTAAARLKDVRLLPQIHKFMRLP